MTREYTVKAGDTLSHIAMRELGNATRWPEIANVNGLFRYPRNPDLIFPGEKLRLPGTEGR